MGRHERDVRHLRAGILLAAPGRPAVEIAFVAFTTVLLLVWFNLPLFLLVLVLTHVAPRWAGVGWNRIGGIWRALPPFLALIFILWLVSACC